MKQRRLSMRFQLLLMYLLVVLAVCMSYAPMSRHVRKQLQEKYEEQIDLRFQQSLRILEDSVKQVYHVPDTMGNYSNYREALVAQGRDGVSEAFPKFYLTTRLLSQYMGTIPVKDKAFVLFKNSGAVIDETQLYLMPEEFVRFGVTVEDMTVEERLAMLEKGGDHHQLAQVRLNQYAARPALMILIDRPHTNVRLGIIYYEETLLDLFHFDLLPPNTCFTLHNLDGELVYQYGEKAENSFCYQGSAYVSGIEMSLYIPPDYYDTLLRSFDDMFTNTLMIAIGVGILLSGILTLINYRPLKQLLRLSGKKPTLGQSNEYALLYEHIQDSDSRIAGLHADVLRLRDNLRASMFARMLYGNVRSAHSIDLSWKLFPQLKNAHYLVLVKMTSPEADASNQPYFFGFLQPLEDEGAYIQQINLNTAALLLPQDDQLVHRLHALLEKEHEALDNSGVSLFAGMSESFTGVDGVYLAHHQAQMVLKNHQVLERYTAQEQANLRPFMDLSALQRLYELLLAGEGDAAEDMIRGMGQEMHARTATRDQQIQCCSLIRFSLDSVAADMRLGDLPRPFVTLDDLMHESLSEMMNTLVQDARMLADSINEMRKRTGGKTRERVMRYIRDNFSSPSIYIDSIAKTNEVSANTVYQIVRECTGRSLGDYIEALRLEMACNLLETTDMPVMDVAAQCGWSVPATFYRVFKQNYGIPPTQYRKQHKS